MNKVLVAGGGGFVGSALVRALAGRGHAVSLFTRDAARSPAGTTPIPIADWSPDSIRAAMAGSCRFDWVFNLTAYGVDPGETDPAAAKAANTDLPLVLLDIAEAAGATAFVHTGSAFEYAEPVTRTAIREDAPLETVKLYGRTKTAGSLAVVEQARARGIHALVPRLFGIYGAGERAWRLLPSLHSRLVRGERVPLTAGLQERDFLYVKDVAACLIALAEAIEGGAVEPQIVNLCSGVPMTVRQFAEDVATALGAPRDLLAFGDIPMRAHEVPFLVGDATRLHQITSWRPAFSLASGILDACNELTRLQGTVKS
jgi:dTDP-6-deoxy-L-talose 4-dehydrogenase (NAD+)